MALGQAVVQNELPLVERQLQQPQLVGQGGLGHPQPLGRFGLGAVPQDHDIPQPLRLFKGVQVGPPHRDGLQQTVFPDALGEARQLRFVKAGPRLIGRGMDVVHREKKDLPG